MNELKALQELIPSICPRSWQLRDGCASGNSGNTKLKGLLSPLTCALIVIAYSKSLFDSVVP